MAPAEDDQTHSWKNNIEELLSRLQLCEACGIGPQYVDHKLTYTSMYKVKRKKVDFCFTLQCQLYSFFDNPHVLVLGISALSYLFVLL